MFAAMAFWTVDEPGEALISSGLATMGFALPAAIATAHIYPERATVCLTGDGGLGMTLAELETASRYSLPLIVVVLNDAALSLIEIKQQPGQGGANAVRHSDVDFSAVARGFRPRCKARRNARGARGGTGRGIRPGRAVSHRCGGRCRELRVGAEQAPRRRDAMTSGSAAWKREITTLMFDQYGTVVDMQTGLTEAVTPFLEEKGWEGAPHRFVTWWRRTHFENSMIDALCEGEHTLYREIGHRAVAYVMDRCEIDFSPTRCGGS